MFSTVKSSIGPQLIRSLSFSPMARQSTKRAEEHIAYLSKFYTPELLQSIKITESLVEPDTILKLTKQGPNALSKLGLQNTDYSKTDPKWDEPVLYPNQAVNKTPYPNIPQVQAPDRSDLKLRFSPGKGPRKDNFATSRGVSEGLSKLTGLDKRYIERLYVRPVVMKRVSCQTSKGKIPNFFALTVVGDGNGMVGLGEGKSRDGMRTALVKAHWNAVKNLAPVQRYEDRTILGDIDYKYHAVKLFLQSAPAGFGLRVNSKIFEVCQAAGIKDLRGKIYKSRNPMNVVKGFVEALTKQRGLQDLAGGRGKKLIDLRKVYYSA
ncbi:28S ribosomal protein S5, mitochondrial [Yamadazyma tenuis]|uniref:Small ribosomal subunit protein uS5m n=1 Tax=Candida tenuis (strain ATCC 10573 / BCRC 21748 / CBS 615 / JCM 9827 / NBRC 10315 / NRRL Y-1498 / VKM Y-70) TaxID=590646 RepID=G3B5B9_CANTC|nr:uncharacterized protein CANTEDRAFT_114497 [Yamadazyma tenuis ATCC 10573]EGV63180.1 hypothetical protein CANTEDRAFT_114497 [Yamadazyma tenuis ATCC 10573]WEJ96997.1 28S ribosomal protein S5, mitochondrial [Yamadazyma tenuis]